MDTVSPPFFDNGVLEARLAHGNWVYITWLNNEIGYLPKSLVKAFKSVELLIKESGLRGWIANSDKSHTGMHKLLEKVGGIRYAEDEEVYFFKKEISKN